MAGEGGEHGLLGKARWWQQVVRWAYVMGLRIWFRWGRSPVSWLAARLRPRRPWQPRAFASLEEAAAWLSTTLVWTSDPLRGALDLIPSLENISYQLATWGQVRDDCDGLAFASAQVAVPFADRSPDGSPQCYVVSVLLDPLRVNVFHCAHVMTFFRREGRWRVISNHELFPEGWDSFLDALTQNGYVRYWQSPVLFAEVRDHRLRFIASGTGERGLQRLGARLG
jgi:hypothetical protein